MSRSTSDWYYCEQILSASVHASTTTVVLAPEEYGRKRVMVYNHSPARLFLKLGPGASSQDFTLAMAADSYFECPHPAVEQAVTGFWTSATGSAMVTRLF